MVTLIHKLANTRRYTQSLHQFMQKRCSQSIELCNNYDDPLLPYGIRNLLALGGEGHKLSLYLIHNKYKEGKGTGGGVNLRDYLSKTKGWASVWHELSDENVAYSARFYTAWFHEIAHAHRFSHKTGMTYGFAEEFSKQLIPELTNEEQRRHIESYRPPEVLISYEGALQNINLSGEMKIHLTGVTTRMEAIDLQIISSCAWSYKLRNLDNQLSLLFDNPPKCPVFIRAASEGATDFATIKISEHQFVRSNTYTIEGKTYTLLHEEILNTEVNAWGIRGKCRLPNMHLATKQEYAVLWQYLYDTNQLEALEIKQFLSSDEPSPYKIWRTYLLEDGMVSNKTHMIYPMGEDTGLVCVSEY